MLNDTEELKIVRENFYNDQDTPEYYKRMAEGEQTPDFFQKSPEVSPDRLGPDGFSPKANYVQKHHHPI